jgi:hypothetical protein
MLDEELPPMVFGKSSDVRSEVWVTNRSPVDGGL